jgi:hypothetical protein
MKTKQKNYESQFLINSILKGEYDKIYIYIYIQLKKITWVDLGKPIKPII